MLPHLALLTPAICAAAAAILAWAGKEGWGWFLFVALLTYPALKLISEQPAAQPAVAGAAVLQRDH